MLHQASCVAIGGRAVLIEGPPGSGKSSLALALIDRGAVLVGDDGVALAARDGRLFASPPPNIAGLLEVRNVGLLRFPTGCGRAGRAGRCGSIRTPRGSSIRPERCRCLACTLPLVRLWPDSPVLALRAEAALVAIRTGLTPPRLDNTAAHPPQHGPCRNARPAT